MPPEALISYFSHTYDRPQRAVDDALQLWRQLLVAYADTPDVKSAVLGTGQILRPRNLVYEALRSWVSNHEQSLTHDASGAYAGPVRHVAARIMGFFMGSPTRTVPRRAGNTVYETPEAPLWPDWDFLPSPTTDKETHAPPVLNGWEQVMWGPFVGPVASPAPENISRVIDDFSRGHTRTALLEWAGVKPPAHPSLPAPLPALVAQRTHAERLLEWAAFSSSEAETDPAVLIERGFDESSSAMPDVQADALWILGEHHFWGTHGAPQNMSMALRCYTQLALLGNATAHARLGYMLSSPWLETMYGVEASQAKSIMHYTLAAQEQVYYAQAALGYRFHRGVDVEADCVTALEWYDRAAIRLYDMFKQGPPGGRTLPYTKLRMSDKARLEFSRAPSLASMRPTNNFNYKLTSRAILARFASQPQAPYDGDAMDELLELYAFHADEGQLTKRYTLARALYDGSLVGDREALGAVWPDLVASAAHAAAVAQTRWPQEPVLTHMDDQAYVNGKLRPVYVAREQALQDHKAAVAAAALLGLQYLRGEGVPQDFEKAKVWLTRAALEDHGIAITYLALMHEHGYGGMTPNSTRAKELLHEASRNTPLASIQIARLDLRTCVY